MKKYKMKNIKRQNRILIALCVTMLTIFACFFAMGCTSQDNNLSLENYSNYIRIHRTGALLMTPPTYATNVRISRLDGVELENAVITFVFRADEFSETFTVNLGRLANYDKRVSFRLDRPPFSPIGGINISMEVIEISGTIVSRPNSGITGVIIFGVIMIVLTLALIIFFIARAGNFSKKIGAIKNGMDYNEVIAILGDPRSSTSAEGIKTCMWSRAVIRGVTNNYIITFKDNKVISKSNNNIWN